MLSQLGELSSPPLIPKYSTQSSQLYMTDNCIITLENLTKYPKSKVDWLHKIWIVVLQFFFFLKIKNFKNNSFLHTSFYDLFISQMTVIKKKEEEIPIPSFSNISLDNFQTFYLKNFAKKKTSADQMKTFISNIYASTLCSSLWTTISLWIKRVFDLKRTIFYFYPRKQTYY